MKLALLLVAGAAAAVAPPRISLNLGMVEKHSPHFGPNQDGRIQPRDYDLAADSAPQVHVITLDSPITRTHNLGYQQPDGTDVGSRQDVTIRCAVCEGTDEQCGEYELTTCHLPMPKAYDHMDEEVQVETHLYLVDYQDDTGASHTTDLKRTSIDFRKRSTYLLKYDAVDFAGNRAEQAVVALILDDLNPPELQVCKHPESGGSALSEIVEAGKGSKATRTSSSPDSYTNGWYLCNDSYAHDSVDGLVTDRIRYFVCKCADDACDIEDAGSCAPNAWTTACLANDSRGCATSQLQTTGGHNEQPISDTELGTYKVKVSVTDKAGIYGQSYENNLQTDIKTVTVVDTEKPEIFLEGTNPAEHECNTTYTDAGAKVFDERDNLWNPDIEVLDYSARVTATGKTCEGATACGAWTDNIELVPADLSKSNPNSQLIEYTASDADDNDARMVTREVKVVDNTPPALNLKGSGHQVSHISHNSTETHQDEHVVDGDTNGSNDPITELGWTCTDTCDERVRDDVGEGHDHHTHSGLITTLSWAGNNAFRDDQEGDYIRVYTCCDLSGNCAYANRTFTVVDYEAPTIVLEGETQVTLEAQHNTDYADAGATCYDYVDKQLDNQVVASGDLVQMSVPGDYVIDYDCSDYSANSATTMKRTVYVQDTTCPQVKINGAAINYLEAGFPYHDDLPSGFATAWDTLDGDLTHKITKEGDSVTTASIFYQRRSCKDIKHVFDTQPQEAGAQTAEYFITRFVASKNNHERVLVWCWMGEDHVDAEAQTVFYVADGKRVPNPYQGGEATADNSCKDHGLVLPVITDYTKPWVVDMEAKYPQAFEMAQSGNNYETNQYICTVPTAGVDHDQSTEFRSRYSALAREEAQMGKYVITYHVTDNAGNKNTCDVDQTESRQCNNNSPTALKVCQDEGNAACAPCNGQDSRRTVIVKDNLPPVISLHDRQKLVNGEDVHLATEQIDALGSHNRMASTDTHDADFAGTHFASALMAEQSTNKVHGWMIAAAASAVTGLALVGVSMRKQKAITTVPV